LKPHESGDRSDGGSYLSFPIMTQIARSVSFHAVGFALELIAD
jgi:hypothetical protein